MTMMMTNRRYGLKNDSIIPSFFWKTVSSCLIFTKNYDFLQKNNGLKLLLLVKMMTSTDGLSDLQTLVTFKHQALLPNRDDDNRSMLIITPYLDKNCAL